MLQYDALHLQLKGAHNIELPNFDQALDEFYGKVGNLIL